MAKDENPDGRKAISKQKFNTLLRQSAKAAADCDEINGGIGAAIKRAVEKDHLNRKVFNTIKTLDRMEPEKLARWLEDFEHYLDISGLTARAESAPALGLGDTKDESEEDDDPEEGEKAPGKGKGGRRAANVSAFPAPRGEAAE